MKPGARASEVFAAMHEVLGAAAGESTGRFGHGLGMRLTEWPSLMAADRTLLEAGMVLTLEPSLTLAPGCLQVHEENVVVGEHGAEWLTPRATRDILRVGAAP